MHTEMLTEPVKFVSDKKFLNTMAQTDPPILDINNEILLPLKLPDQHDFKDLCFIAPKPEVMFTVRPKTPEDPRNWAESPLY